MGVYKNIEVDFVERTKENLDFLENNKIILPQEITHLLNYCYGLFVMPEQKMNDIISKMPQDLSFYGIKEEYITTHRKKSFANVIRSMRNGFAHAHLKSLSMKGCDQFVALSIEDYSVGKDGKKKEKPHTIIELSIEQLRNFISKFSQEYVKSKKHLQNEN